jgi:hypothetical protein
MVKYKLIMTMNNVLILRVLVLDGLIGLYCIILRKIIYVYK